MYPILARLGPYFIYSYTVVMIMGVGAGLILAFYLNSERKTKNLLWFDGLLVALVAAFLGGRIAFVWANWHYYQENVAEIGQVWQGGLSYHGALIAGLLTFWVWSIIRRNPFSYSLALLAPSLALASAFGWAACWLDGCAYGRVAMPGLLSALLPDEFGVMDLRYRTQLLGLIVSLLVLIIALILWRRRQSKLLAWMTLLLLSIGRLFITLLRGDRIPMINSIRIDTVAESLLIITCFIGLFVIIVNRKGNR
jgi:phosphatidylglycerol:prolipoprotein diacylglycerol transferase